MAGLYFYMLFNAPFFFFFFPFILSHSLTKENVARKCIYHLHYLYTVIFVCWTLNSLTFPMSHYQLLVFTLYMNVNIWSNNTWLAATIFCLLVVRGWSQREKPTKTTAIMPFSLLLLSYDPFTQNGSLEVK